MRCVEIAYNKRFTKLLKCGSVSGGVSETDASVKSHLRKNFPYRRPLNEEGFLQKFIDGRLFGYVQCDIEVPDHLRDYFSNFPPMFKNTTVSKDDIGSLMKSFAEKENIMVQPKECSYQAVS